MENMASKSQSKEGCCSWTPRQNKEFERALALFDKETPERWQNIAEAVGDKSAEEVKKHYQVLLEDLTHIESGLVPIPNYKSMPSTCNVNEQERPVKNIKLQ